MFGILSGGLEKFYVEYLRNLVMRGNVNGLLASLCIVLRYAFRASLLFEVDMLNDLKKSDYLLSNITHLKVLAYDSNAFFYVSFTFNLILIAYLLLYYIIATNSYLNTTNITTASSTNATASSKASSSTTHSTNNSSKTHANNKTSSQKSSQTAGTSTNTATDSVDKSFFETALALTQTVFSHAFQAYNYAFLIPFTAASFTSSSEITLWPLNIAFILIISGVCSMNQYEYSFKTKNWLARRGCSFEQILLSGEIIACWGYGFEERRIVVAALIGVSALGIWQTVFELPFFNSWIQSLNVAMLFGETLLLLLIGAALLIDGVPVIFGFVSILPLAIGLSILVKHACLSAARDAVISLAVTGEVNFNPNWIDIFLRSMYEINSMKFSFTQLYATQSTSVLFQTILNSFGQQSIQSSDQSELEVYIGITSQQRIIYDFFRESFKRVIELSPSDSRVRYSYLSYLIEINGQRTVAYLEILNEKQSSNRLKSLSDQQVLQQILEQASQYFKYETFMNDHINVLSIILNDAELAQNQQLLEECLTLKKSILNKLSQTSINLKSFRFDANSLIHKRRTLKRNLRICAITNESNPILKDQIISFIEYLSMGDCRLSDFMHPPTTPSTLLTGAAEKKLASIASPMYKSSRFAIVFITLIKNIGEIMGASNNLTTFFEYTHQELIGHNINTLIPPVIAVRHQMILNGFTRRGANNHNFQNFRFIFGQNKRGFIMPVMLKLKIESLASDDFGISGIFRKLSDRSDFLMVDSNFRIAGISEHFFKSVFSSDFQLAEMRQINIIKLIPLFSATVEIQNQVLAAGFESQGNYDGGEDELFETFMLVNSARDARNLLMNRSVSIEKDVKEIRLATSELYKILYKFDYHEGYGFSYYNLTLQQCKRISKKSDEYQSMFLSFLEQLRSVSPISNEILLDILEQLKLIIGGGSAMSIEESLLEGVAKERSLLVTALPLANTSGTPHMFDSNVGMAASFIASGNILSSSSGPAPPINLSSHGPSSFALASQNEQFTKKKFLSNIEELQSEKGNQDDSSLNYSATENHTFKDNQNSSQFQRYQLKSFEKSPDMHPPQQQPQVKEQQTQQQVQKKSLIFDKIADIIQKPSQQQQSQPNFSSHNISQPHISSDHHIPSANQATLNSLVLPDDGTIETDENAQNLVQNVNVKRNLIDIFRGRRISQFVASELVQKFKRKEKREKGFLMQQKQLQQRKNAVNIHSSSPSSSSGSSNSIETPGRKFKPKENSVFSRRTKKNMIENNRKAAAAESAVPQTPTLPSIGNNNNRTLSAIPTTKSEGKTLLSENASPFFAGGGGVAEEMSFSSIGSPLLRKVDNKKKPQFSINIQQMLQNMQTSKNPNQNQISNNFFDDNVMEVSRQTAGDTLYDGLFKSTLPTTTTQQSLSNQLNGIAGMGTSKMMQNSMITSAMRNYESITGPLTSVMEESSRNTTRVGGGAGGTITNSYSTMRNANSNPIRDSQNENNHSKSDEHRSNVQLNLSGSGGAVNTSKMGSGVMQTSNYVSVSKALQIQKQVQKNTASGNKAAAERFDVFDYDFSSSESERSDEASPKKTHHHTNGKHASNQSNSNNIGGLASRSGGGHNEQRTSDRIEPTNDGNEQHNNKAGKKKRKHRNMMEDDYDEKHNQMQQQLNNNDGENNQFLDEDDGKSQQSESTRRNQFLQKQIMAQISRLQKDEIIACVQVIGFVLLAVIGIGNLMLFVSVSSSVSAMNDSIEFIQWPMDVKSEILLIIKGDSLLKYYEQNAFSYDPAIVAQYYELAKQEIQANYVKLRTIMLQASQRDTDQYYLFDLITNSEFTFSLLDSDTTTSLTSSVQYSLEIMAQFLYRLSYQQSNNDLDQTNVVVNYLSLIKLLDGISKQLIEKQRELKESLFQTLQLGIYGLVSVSSCFALSVFPLLVIVTQASEKITGLFSTFSPQLLSQMHNHLTGYIKFLKPQLQQTISQKTIAFLASSRIEKKRNNSEVSRLPSVRKIHVILSGIFFILIVLYPIVNYILSNSFSDEFYFNIQLVEKLEYLKSLSIENVQLNYMLSFKKMFPSISYPTVNVTEYQQLGLNLIDQNSNSMLEIETIMKEYHIAHWESESDFEQFIIPMMEQNSCAQVTAHPEFFATGETVDFTECESVRKGILKKGLILSLVDTFAIFPFLTQLYAIPSAAMYRAYLTAAQRQTSLIEIDSVNVIISKLITASRNSLRSISDSYYSSMHNIQSYLIAYQFTMLLLIFYFGWSKFCQILQSELFKSKELFSLFNVNYLIDNPYFYSYFSKRRFKL